MKPTFWRPSYRLRLPEIAGLAAALRLPGWVRSRQAASRAGCVRLTGRGRNALAAEITTLTELVRQHTANGQHAANGQHTAYG
jgi:hypothetical protein